MEWHQILVMVGSGAIVPVLVALAPVMSERLRARNAKTISDVEAAVKFRDQLMERIDDLEVRDEKRSTEIDNLRSELALTRAQLEMTRAQLADALADAERYRAENMILADEIERLRASEETCQRTTDALREELARQNRELVQLKESVREGKLMVDDHGEEAASA